MKDLADCRVLIVDDVKANIDVLVEALRDDHKLAVALNGEMALRMIEKSPPDLVLLDIVMPGLDGYEVCRRLRDDPATMEIPIMFLSSLDEVRDKTRGFEAGGNDYLTKPFELLEVKARVRSLLKAKAYSDAVKEKLAAELRIAREIQHGILPANAAQLVQGTQLDLCAVLESAREVGGDLYEVLPLDDGRMLIAVGDVSGKGVPAALFMAVCTTLLRSMARHYAQPEDIVRQVNDALATQNPRQMFVTLFCMILDPVTGHIVAANAGHNAPVLIRAGGSPEFVLPSTAMIAGILAGIEVSSATLELAPGDTLVLYTDGVTEAMDMEGTLYGDDRLALCLAAAGAETAADLTECLRESVRAHAGEHPQSDDITVVAIRRQSPPG